MNLKDSHITISLLITVIGASSVDCFGDFMVQLDPKNERLLSVLTFTSDFSHLATSVLLPCLEPETLEAFT